MFYNVLLSTYFILFAALSCLRLNWAVYLIIFALPGYLIRFQIFGIPMTLLESMILILFLALAIKKSGNLEIRKLKQIIINHKLYYFIILFLSAATVSVFVSPDPRAALGIWKAYFIEPILFLLVFVSVIDKYKLKNIFLAFSSSAFLLSLIAIYQKITGNLISNSFWAAEATRRVTSVFEYPNALALYLPPIIILIIGFGIAQIKKVKNWNFNNYLFIIYHLLFVGIVVASTIFTKSKGAIIAILAGLIFYAIFYKNYHKYFISLLTIIFISLYLYIFIFGLPDLRGVATVDGGDSITTRINMWQETWAMLKDRPIFGAGLAGYQTIIAPYHQKNYIEIFLYPHNIFLTFWSEIGLLGLVVFLLIIAWFYKIGFNKNLLVAHYPLPIVLMASMTTLLIHGLVDTPYFKNDLSVLFWLLIGSIIILNKKMATKTKTRYNYIENSFLNYSLKR